MTPDDQSRDAFNGADLVAARHALSLSQSQLAELLDVPVNTLARWERGEVSIRHPRILALAMEALSARLATGRAASPVAS